MPLEACEPDDALFPPNLARQRGQSIADVWFARYHATVRGVIDAHLEALQQDGSCTEERTPPSDELERLAEDMAGWRSVQIGEEDMPAILLDYLRAAECTWQHRSQYLVDQVVKELVEDSENGQVAALDITQGLPSERLKLEHMMQLARGTLHRALTYYSGYGRLHALERSLSCLSNATIDIRNVLGLAAEASMCMPRIWDARTSIRTDATQ